jgi:hypothetical protein
MERHRALKEALCELSGASLPISTLETFPQQIPIKSLLRVVFTLQQTVE